MIIVILISITWYALYKYNPLINQIVDINLMNMREVTTFEVKGNEVYMSGLINSQTYNQFVKIIEENPQITTIVELDMEGSIDDHTMIKLAYYVRKKWLNTKLLSYSDINSGAVDLFLAGVERTMEKGAHIGVHSWSNGFKEAKEFPKDAEEHEMNRKYIEDMLGKDEFYWFTIYVAPAGEIYEMTEEEIQKYGLLTQPIIRENLTKTDNMPATLVNKFGRDTFGNINSDTVIINSQGGPVSNFDFEGTYDILVNQAKINLEKTLVVNVHQEQTLKPWKFNEKEITFEQAKEYDKKSVERLVDVIKYFKSKGKKVYVVGISFGAFMVQDSLAEYGNIADKYLIMVGRLNIPEKVWNEFKEGHYVGFEYDKKGNSKIIPFNAEQAGMGGSESVEDKNMAKLAAGLWYKRYTELLKNKKLDNVTYAYWDRDEQVWKLTQKEVEFLKSKNVKVYKINWTHSDAIDEFSIKHLKNILNAKSRNHNFIENSLNTKETPYSIKIDDKYYISKNSKKDEQFFIGSMTKVFTSTLIFYLQEKGFLDINDKVTKYIKLPTLSDTVKIKDLLSHNSGIRDKEQTKTFQDLYTKNQEKTYLTSVSLKDSIFTEDKSFVYSNTNYIILGEIIKNITGKTFNEYVDEIIVKKLWLKNTCSELTNKNCHPIKWYLNLEILEMEKEIVQLKSTKWFTTLSASAWNLVSNLEDLDIFLKALVNDKFFKFSNMIDKDTEYLYGIRNFWNGNYGHSGQALDTVSVMLINKETKKTSIILLWDSSIDVYGILEFLFSSK